MATQFGQETQTEAAQRMYNARAPNYDASWHGAYSRRFIAHAPLRPNDRVLDLCCGTGGEAFLAAELVGEQGRVVAVDVTEGMLARLRERQAREPVLGRRITVVQHDVTDLSRAVLLLEDGGGLFDAVLCSTAFVLLGEPGRVVAHWKEFLRPGGVMVIDVTHERNLRAGLVLEEVAREMGVERFPSRRGWIKSEASFREVLEAQGLRVERVSLVENISGKGTQYHGVEEADRIFEQTVNSSLTENVASDDFKAKARPLFRREWERIAVDGKVEDVDSLYVYVARKPE
ncbi:S-adenosyl-L-methionine-dependent methyltransferase [Cryphonectria parasitica EP155]|uniref:S-adenosyl-L-methionine-dependent methyltransferase n=1 Tax=Cryphonectria parasitica (strain ATCC 38755 / EP155) TaxID=660469 RepID=A0A9P4XTD4_CRYP1|nr:S-adenosyl-L-methionine-dependent methyltransferase [Cryphonectria parasitica EP155]KAF3760496.1 S-adenosyl-L-methionine-dependent methyltransferase [Cryphonectria parasitica EP155]